MLMGLLVGLMLLAGLPGCRKWTFAHASAIPNSFLVWIVLAALLAVSTGVEQFPMLNVMSSSSLVASVAY